MSCKSDVHITTVMSKGFGVLLKPMTHVVRIIIRGTALKGIQLANGVMSHDMISDMASQSE